MHFNHLQLKITNLILTLSEKVTKINKITKQKFFILMQMVTFKLNSEIFIFSIYFFEILKMVRVNSVEKLSPRNSLYLWSINYGR